MHQAPTRGQAPSSSRKQKSRRPLADRAVTATFRLVPRRRISAFLSDQLHGIAAGLGSDITGSRPVPQATTSTRSTSVRVRTHLARAPLRGVRRSRALHRSGAPRASIMLSGSAPRPCPFRAEYSPWLDEPETIRRARHVDSGASTTAARGLLGSFDQRTVNSNGTRRVDWRAYRYGRFSTAETSARPRTRCGTDYGVSQNTSANLPAGTFVFVVYGLPRRADARPVARRARTTNSRSVPVRVNGFRCRSRAIPTSAASSSHSSIDGSSMYSRRTDDSGGQRAS